MISQEFKKKLEIGKHENLANYLEFGKEVSYSSEFILLRNTSYIATEFYPQSLMEYLSRKD
jgi:hypothetical protein